MPSALKAFAFVFPLVAAAACGSSATVGGSGGSTGATTGTATTTSTGSHTTTTGTTSGGGGSGPTGTKACGDEAAAVCSLRDTCSPGYNNKLVYGTEAICQARTQQTCVNALDAKGTGNTPAKVEACAAAYPKEACASFFDANPVTVCQAPLGTLAAGAACGANAQCTSGYCAVTSTTVCGTCQSFPVAGASCAIQADCGRDLACAIPNVNIADAGIPTSGKCAAWVASGGACLTGFNPCASGLSCVGDDEAAMTMGTCQPAGATVGAACQTTHKTVAGCYGALGLGCLAPPKANGMGTCQPVALLASGAPCGALGTPVTSFAACAAGGLCRKAAPSDLTGTCVAPALDGAACDADPSIGPPCLTPAKCVAPNGSSGTAGTCTVPNATTCK